LAAVFTLLLLVMAVPRLAQAYVDPGSGAMLWQVAAAAVIGALFYVRRFVMWLRERMGLRTPRTVGLLFATLYSLVTSPLVCTLFHSRPLPRFNDIFLVGIVLTTYLFTWESAVYLLVLSLGVSAYVLPPYGSFAVALPEDWYRMASFACISIFLIGLVHRLKTRTPALASSSFAPELSRAASAD